MTLFLYRHDRKISYECVRVSIGAEAGVNKHYLTHIMHHCDEPCMSTFVTIHTQCISNKLIWEIWNMCTAVGRVLSIRCFSKCHSLSLSSQLLAYIYHSRTYDSFIFSYLPVILSLISTHIRLVTPIHLDGFAHQICPVQSESCLFAINRIPEVDMCAKTSVQRRTYELKE